MSKIEEKTFLRTRKLQSLDLSNNQLKKINFKIFLPRFKDLEILYLEGNKIKDLNLFRRAIFPGLNILGIQNNNFNCSYLHTLFDSVIWHELTVDVERIHSIELDGSNVGGIRCTRVIEEEPDDYIEAAVEIITTTANTTTKLIPNKLVMTSGENKQTMKELAAAPQSTSTSDGNGTLHTLLTIIIIILSGYLIYNIALNKDKIIYYIRSSRPLYRRNNSQSNLTIAEPIPFNEIENHFK